MKRAGVAGVVLIAAFMTTGGSAWAGSAVRLCVPKAQERPTLTPKRGKCRKGYTLLSLGTEGKEGRAGKTGAEGRPGPEGKAGLEGKVSSTGFTSSELETLKSILPHTKFVASGIAGKPTIQFSGVNVQIVNGEGNTQSANGEGNLVIGYDENPLKNEQTGSHDLIMGEDQTFTSYGGIVAGTGNAITAEYASVSGGLGNTASGPSTSISGGASNAASNFASSISGGYANVASGPEASVSGGHTNKATESQASVTGGGNNTASGAWASVSGGNINSASRSVASISGGEENKAEAELSWIGGGKGNIVFPAAKLASIVSDGFGNGVEETACVGAPKTFFESLKC
jgi:hypothetical protein